MSPEEKAQLAEELRKSGRAKEVLENEVFKDAVRKIEEALLAGMRGAAIQDDKLRLRLLDKYECLYAIVEEIRSVVNTGELAKEQLSVLDRVKNLMN